MALLALPLHTTLHVLDLLGVTLAQLGNMLGLYASRISFDAFSDLLDLCLPLRGYFLDSGRSHG